VGQSHSAPASVRNTQFARAIGHSRVALPDSPRKTRWLPEARHDGIRLYITFFATDAVPFVHRILRGLAWLFYYKARGEIEAALVPEEAAGIRTSWERFLKQHRPNRDTILIGFALVEDADTCAFLLQRTVFLPTSPDTYRFVHRSWQEFLLAQYFALCLERACFEDLGRAKFTLAFIAWRGRSCRIRPSMKP